MTKLIMTQGLPASGKTTFARAMVGKFPNLVRLNRDDFHQMLFGKLQFDTNSQAMVTAAQHGAVENALKAGFDVIVDDTNFFPRGVNSLVKIAHKHGATVEIIDFTHVSVDECVRRDEIRRQEGKSNLSSAVGEKVIRDMHKRYLQGREPFKPNLKPLEIEPYEADESLKPAIIVDIDGTLATMTNPRCPRHGNESK